jgi:ribosome-binding protein aMBF1 (putative translation factor)
MLSSLLCLNTIVFQLGCVLSLRASDANVRNLMPAHIQVQFGRSVRKLRLKRKLSQEQLAEAADLHQNYIGRIERAQVNASLINIGKLARALKVKPAELFRGIH